MLIVSSGGNAAPAGALNSLPLARSGVGSTISSEDGRKRVKQPRSRGSAQQMDSYHAHSGRSAPSYARI